MEFVLDWFEKLKGLLLDKWLEHSIYFFFFQVKNQTWRCAYYRCYCHVCTRA